VKDFYGNRALIREDRILGNEHLDVAIMYALRNMEKGEMISRSLWNEILLYLSMQRQVHRALEMLGVKNYRGKVVVVEEGSRDKINITISQEKKDFWGVSSGEELLERMALFHLENH